MTIEFHPVGRVHRWHTTNDISYELRSCVLSMKGIRMIEEARIVRQVEGQPLPHEVYAIVGEDWSTVFIEPDGQAEDFIEEWAEFCGATHPEDILDQLFPSRL